MKQFCLACDLRDDDMIIKAYDTYHKNVATEIKDSITSAGIHQMEIYRTGNRLFMIIVADDDFSFEEKAAMDLANPLVQKWERLMSEHQSQLPWAEPDVKWVLMDRIFNLERGPK